MWHYIKRGMKPGKKFEDRRNICSIEQSICLVLDDQKRVGSLLLVCTAGILCVTSALHVKMHHLTANRFEDRKLGK